MATESVSGRWSSNSMEENGPANRNPRIITYRDPKIHADFGLSYRSNSNSSAFRNPTKHNILVPDTLYANKKNSADQGGKVKRRSPGLLGKGKDPASPLSKDITKLSVLGGSHTRGEGGHSVRMRERAIWECQVLETKFRLRFRYPGNTIMWQKRVIRWVRRRGC